MLNPTENGMDKSLKLSRLNDLLALVVSTPEDRVYLNDFQQKDQYSISEDGADDEVCGSTFCIAGLAWVHKPFIADGIRVIESDRWRAAIYFFEASHELFAPRRTHEDLSNPGMSDKKLAVARIEREISATTRS